MWYLADLLFAEPPHADRVEFQCESSNVLFQAPTAAEAYRRAVAWSLAYASEPPAGMRFLGVSHLTTVGEELGDGTEVCGRFFRDFRVWDRGGELVPPPGQLQAVLWEQGRDVPLGELLRPEQVAQLEQVSGQAASQGTTPDTID